jgi:hypothetical protein
VKAHTASLAVYRRALRLYPKRFRDEYGDDLVLLLGDQLGDEPTWRVLTRSAVDLALTVPARHLEARMDRTPTPVVPLLFGLLAFASMGVALFVGHPFVLLGGSAVSVTAICLAVLAALRARAIKIPVPISAHWWKVLASGAGLLATLIVVTTATGELPEGGWMIAMITGLTAFLLTACGRVLGIARLVGRSPDHIVA